MPRLNKRKTTTSTNTTNKPASKRAKKNHGISQKPAPLNTEEVKRDENDEENSPSLAQISPPKIMPKLTIHLLGDLYSGSICQTESIRLGIDHIDESVTRNGKMVIIHVFDYLKNETQIKISQRSVPLVAHEFQVGSIFDIKNFRVNRVAIKYRSKYNIEIWFTDKSRATKVKDHVFPKNSWNPVSIADTATMGPKHYFDVCGYVDQITLKPINVANNNQIKYLVEYHIYDDNAYITVAQWTKTKPYLPSLHVGYGNQICGFKTCRLK